MDTYALISPPQKAGFLPGRLRWSRGGSQTDALPARPFRDLGWIPETRLESSTKIRRAYRDRENLNWEPLFGASGKDAPPWPENESVAHRIRTDLDARCERPTARAMSLTARRYQGGAEAAHAGAVLYPRWQ